MGYKVGFIEMHDARTDGEECGRYDIDRDITKWIGSERISEYGKGSRIVLVEDESEARVFSDIYIARTLAEKHGGWRNVTENMREPRVLLCPVIYSD